MVVVYIIITLLILGILILFHEYGHFLAARLLGVGVLEFSLGMGPKLYQKKINNTLFSIRALPLGGYCALQGEDEDLETDDSLISPEEYNPNNSFFNKPAWVRIVILIAGVTMNFLLAFVVIFLASLLSGRDFLDSMTVASKTFVDIIGLIFLSLKMLFTGEAGLNDLAGPIGMVQMVGELYQYGLIMLLLFTAMLSINLGILNLLPIPALDGGQILLILIEKIKRGEISQKLKTKIITISYLLLILLAVVIAFNDLGRIMIGK